MSTFTLDAPPAELESLQSGTTLVELDRLGTDELLSEYFRLRMQGPRGIQTPRYGVLEQLLDDRNSLAAYF